MKNKYSIISLFTGAGGLDLGFLLNGKFDIKFANEILKAPVLTYSKNFKIPISESRNLKEIEMPVIIHNNIENIDFSDFPLKNIDVVIGGPPCQDFSVLRGKSKRKGVEVKRGRLYSHFVRALVHLKPKVFLFENVPGLITSNEGFAFETIKEDFKNLSLRWDEVKKLVQNGSEIEKNIGYELIFSNVLEFYVLGVPQIRRRLIIIGIRNDLINNLDLIMRRNIEKNLRDELEGKKFNFKYYPLTPLEVFEGKILTDLQEKYEKIMKDYSNIADEVNTPRAKIWKNKIFKNLTFNIIDDYIYLNKYKKLDSLEYMRFVKDVMAEHEEVLKLLDYLNKPIRINKFPDNSNKIPNESKNVIERMSKIPPGENYAFLNGTKWEVKGLMSNIYRRVHPLEPAQTVIAYGGGGTWGYHYEKDRGRLTNRELARLQTFPDWFLFSGNSQEIRAQIGEAVPPLAGYRISKVLEQILSFFD
jgi:DNA (cytosine-5)-methyltransferase 1